MGGGFDLGAGSTFEAGDAFVPWGGGGGFRCFFGGGGFI